MKRRGLFFGQEDVGFHLLDSLKDYDRIKRSSIPSIEKGVKR
jgi:hypothetical protein